VEDFDGSFILQLLSVVLTSVLSWFVIGFFRRVKQLEKEQHEQKIMIVIMQTNYNNITNGLNDIKTAIEKQSEKLQNLAISQGRKNENG
jgi:predicted permease